MAISVFWERSYAEIREILLKGWWNLCLPHTDGGKAKDLSTSDSWRLYGCCFETTISLETWFKVLLKRKFKVAVFYLKYFFIPRSLITKNNATLRPRSRRDRRLKRDKIWKWSLWTCQQITTLVTSHGWVAKRKVAIADIIHCWVRTVNFCFFFLQSTFGKCLLQTIQIRTQALGVFLKKWKAKSRTILA